MNGFRAYLPAIAIIAASVLFAGDGMFRESALRGLDSRSVSFLEYGVALFVSSIAVFFFRTRGAAKETAGKGRSRSIHRSDILSFLVIGLGGAALGNVFYSLSVERIGSEAATTFTMLQPMAVLALAWVFLRERFSTLFVPCAIWVVANMILLSFSQWSGSFSPLGGMTGEGMEAIEDTELASGAVYALTAAMIWGASTVAGKHLVGRFPIFTVLFWRFAIAFLASGAMLFFSEAPFPSWSVLLASGALPQILALGILSQFLAYSVYYYGLRVLPASLATFIELIYPLSGVFLPVFFSGKSVSTLQAFASVSLVVALVLLLAAEYPRSRKQAA
jgi:drug/metabolite transporter (DMT)-like permease